MGYFWKHRKGFGRLLAVVTLIYFASFFTLYFSDYQPPNCTDVISKEQYDHQTKMLNYEPTEEELRMYKEYSEEIDRIYEKHMEEHGLTDPFDRFLIDERELNLPKNPYANKGYFIEKDNALYSYYEAPIRKYEKCNEPWYWKYLKPTLVALIIYIASLMALWFTYSIVHWVIKGFKQSK